MASRIKKNQHTKPDIQVQDFLSSEQVKGELKDIPLIQVDLSGINVQGIEKSQAKIVKERLKKLSPRIRDLENRIKHLTDGAIRKEAA